MVVKKRLIYYDGRSQVSYVRDETHPIDEIRVLFKTRHIRESLKDDSGLILWKSGSTYLFEVLFHTIFVEHASQVVLS